MSGSEKDEGRITVELKICERCGGLWLRPQASRWIYCGGCKKKVSELPPATAVQEKRRLRYGRGGAANGSVAASIRRQSERVQ